MVCFVECITCLSISISYTVAVNFNTPGQMETKVAATIYANGTFTAAADIANQTSTAFAKLSPFIVARTADAMTAAVRTPIPTSSTKKYNVSVPASACWMNSKVNVLAGQRVMIVASGTASTYEGHEDSNSGPDGQVYTCGAIECPVQGASYGSLIGRVEDQKPFFVGSYIEFVPTKGGQLYFTINDWKCDDNSRTFELVITIP